MKLTNAAISTLLATLILLQVIAAFSLNASATSLTSKTLIVPDEYPTITAAIANASQGDTILVKSGTYFENPIINKTITIEAENPTNTFVIGVGGIARGANPVFTIAADGVTISGFTIQSQNYSNPTNYASGIIIAGDNCAIVENKIVGTYYGIFCSVQSYLTITQNTILQTQKEGIRICGGTNNTISDNTIALNAQSGIALDGYADSVTNNQLLSNNRGLGLGAPYSLVFGNEFSGNAESGLYVASSNSLIVANNMTNSKYGIYFTSFFAAPNNNTFYQNNITNNTQNVATTSTLNTQNWDNGAQGNYWSDYNATSNANAYTAYAENTDNHPLTTPYQLTSNSQQPNMPAAPETFNGTVSTWHFDEVEPNGVTPDSLDNSPVILEPTGNTYTPILVEGKFGKALQFNGSDYAYATISPTLNLHGEITIDAWVKVQEYKENVSYNNIFVECTRTTAQFPTRILAFAINGQSPQNSTQPPQGALRGFFLDDKGVFNEIDTTQAVVPLNQWVHVVFVRSLTTGMHIYVNGKEAQVEVASGSQNPTSNIARGTEFYIGHDSFSTIDELSISTTALSPTAETNQP
ncbi:MAG TPA: NosD domain-containing protein, partial [Candidatus Nanoarchaeia archaeon]|nr:NosD domain-containing protein [Candidatus Nanoarchaeia archaeon]